MTSVRNIYEQCKSVGIIDTQTDFSIICGRRGNWASSAMARDLGMPLDTLTSCYCHLLHIQDTEGVPDLLGTIWNTVCLMVQNRHREINNRI